MSKTPEYRCDRSVAHPLAGFRNAPGGDCRRHRRPDPGAVVRLSGPAVGGGPQPGILGDLHHRGLIYIAERLTKPKRLNRIKFAVTDVGEKVIKTVFSADPDQVIGACQMYPFWVQTEVTDVLSVDISQLPELLVSEDPIVSGTASLALSWLRKSE